MPYRNPILIALATVIVLAAIYSGYWVYARGVALELVAGWIAEQRKAGIAIAHEPPVSGGYPFLIRIDLGQVTARAAEGQWQGTIPQLELEVQPWNFRQLRLQARGRQQWQWRQGGATRQAVLASSEAVAVGRVTGTGRIRMATLRLLDLALEGDPGAYRAAELWLEAVLPPQPPASHTEPFVSLSLSAADAVLPPAAETALGRKIESLRADAKLLGRFAGPSPQEAMEFWRSDGGTLEVDWLRVVWGDVDLRAKGTLALDEAHRPLGAFTADIRGHDAILEALKAAAVLDDNTVALAKVGLSLLARRPPEGGAPVLTVPITAQDGQLYAGPVRIADLPGIRLSAQPH